MNTYTINHPAEALSVIVIAPTGYAYAGCDRMYIGLTDHEAAKKYNTMYLVHVDRATGAILMAEAHEDMTARRNVYGEIDEAGRALLAEVIAGDKFAADHFNLDS